MARIFSFSVTEGAEKEFGRAVREFGFKNRSEMVRAGVRSLLAEMGEIEKLKGMTTAVAVIVHSSDADDAVAHVRHSFSDIVSTQVHNSTAGECLEVFVLHGQASRIAELSKELKSNRKIKYSRIVSAKTA